MPRQTRSPWDFGELFPPEATRRVLTVSELTLQVKRLLEAQFGSLWVSGEVSNLRVQASGHAYFTLKDAGAQLACVLFRGAAGRATRDLLEDGRKVLLQGEVTVYEPRGQYQFVVRAVELQGVGALQLAFERLKQKLQAEGLFAPERKRALPDLAVRIGVVTSPTGAALRDVLHVLHRRQPWIEVLLAPSRVQGDGAALEVAAAIGLLNAFHARILDGTAPGPPLDLILLTRGGGSLEDLWAFNEEPVARAIHASALPVVSAVGHEIDFTISDFVADLRAATPSAAAELVSQGGVTARDFVREARERLPDLARAGHDDAVGRFTELRQRVGRAHPRRRLNEVWQRVDDLLSTLQRTGRFAVREARAQWESVSAVWTRLHPGPRLASYREELERARARLGERARQGRDGHRQRLAALVDRLRLLSPEQTLARGYSITRDARTGRVLRRPEEAPPGTVLNTRLQGGDLRSVAD